MHDLIILNARMKNILFSSAHSLQFWTLADISYYKYSVISYEEDTI